MKPLGDGFIKLIKMVIAPVVFLTLVHGIASGREASQVGRVGVKALVYFEVVSTFALLIGLMVAKLLQTGSGFNIDPAALDASAVQSHARRAASESVSGHLLAITPNSFFGAFAEGDLLQVLLIAILTGFAINALPERVRVPASHVIEVLARIFFGVVAILVRAAPIGAFGAMAFTIGEYGIGSIVRLAELVATFYLTAILFVLIVLGTSSSETVLPQLMRKLERLGWLDNLVGLTVPLGYGFNLDGTNIYMTLATMFLAYATNTHLTWEQEFTILAVAMLTSKGASGVTRAGFVTLAATLSVIPNIPIQALAVLVGIDKFMSECRALTNPVGNGVACAAVSRWEGELDLAQLRAELVRGPRTISLEEPVPAAGTAD